MFPSIQLYHDNLCNFVLNITVLNKHLINLIIVLHFNINV